MNSTAPAAAAVFVGRLGEYRIPDGLIRIAGENELGLWFHRANRSTGIVPASLDTVSGVMVASDRPSSAGDCAGPKGDT